MGAWVSPETKRKAEQAWAGYQYARSRIARVRAPDAQTARRWREQAKWRWLKARDALLAESQLEGIEREL